MNKEISLFKKFGVLSVVLPYYSNIFNQWENLMTKLSKNSSLTWFTNFRAFKNLHSSMKYREVHTYIYEFDDKYLKYIENCAKNKNIVFNIILESHYSYRKFIEFLGSINVCKVFNKIYTLNHTMNLNYICKICGFLQKNGIPLEIISSNTYEIIKYYKTHTMPYDIYSYKLQEGSVPYLHTVVGPDDMTSTNRCENLIFSKPVYKCMQGGVLLQADKIWMQLYEVKAMLESKCEFSEILKESVKTFVLYNSTSKLQNIKSSVFTTIPIDSINSLDLMLMFAVENFPKLESFEISKFGFSALKFNEILDTKYSLKLTIDMYELPEERNFLSAENATFVLRNKVKSNFKVHSEEKFTIVIVKADKIEIEWEEDEKTTTLFSSFHNYEVFDKIACFRGENIRIIEECDYFGNENISNMIDYIELKPTQNYTCGITLNGLKQLNLLKYSPMSIIPFHCAHAELSIPINLKGQLLLQNEYFKSLLSFTPLVLTFELNTESEFDDFEDDNSVISTLGALNVIELRITSAPNEEFILQFIEKYKKSILNWKGLRNFYTQIELCKGTYRNPKFDIDYKVHPLLKNGKILRDNTYCDYF